MNNMNGYKTFAAALVSIIAGALTMLGIGVPAETLQELSTSIEMLIGGLMSAYGVVMILFRAVSTSPMFNKDKKQSDIFPLSILCLLFVSLLFINGCAAQANKMGPVVKRGASDYCLASPLAREQIRADWDAALAPYQIRIMCPALVQD